jgi:hypothetical protein
MIIFLCILGGLNLILVFVLGVYVYLLDRQFAAVQQKTLTATSSVNPITLMKSEEGYGVVLPDEISCDQIKSQEEQDAYFWRRESLR